MTDAALPQSDPSVVPTIPTVPVTIGTHIITQFKIKSLSLKATVSMVNAARDSGADYTVAIQRERFIRQITPIDGTGAAVPFTLKDVLELPIYYAKLLRVALTNQPDAPRGEVIKAGDGISEPCVFKLGTPVGTSEGTITELEFFAKTLGDIEAVYASDSGSEQALTLIETIATPLGSAPNLLRMPAWAIDSITIEDGVGIMQDVLPRFL